MKAIDRLTEASAQSCSATFSFKYFLPCLEEKAEELYEQLERIVVLQHLFCDLPRATRGRVLKPFSEICVVMLQIRVETMMHITCVDMPARKIDEVLDKIKEKGIENVPALRGDPPHGQGRFIEVSGKGSCARDLAKAHPDVISSEEGATEVAYYKDLMFLKEKRLQDIGVSKAIQWGIYACMSR
ncbi:hypothetical protein L7F22_035351 [Adiantum nelumboides]|nr:hypothetical protein [Adiantum nelumboides]